MVWIGESEPALNRYSELLLIRSPSPPLLSVPPSQPLPELEHLPAALSEAPRSWDLSLQPLGLDLCPSLPSPSPWGDRAARVYCSWGVCMSPHSYIYALQVSWCSLFTAGIVLCCVYCFQSQCRCYLSGEARMRMRSHENLGACPERGVKVLTVLRV